MTGSTISGVRLAWTAVAADEVRREIAWRLLRGLLPEDAELSNPCARCGGPHGPVRVAGADALASVSYAGGLAIVGVADAALFEAFGIDAEADHDGVRDAAGLGGVLGRRHASVRDWTRVEATLKADGRGLRVDPARVVVRPVEPRPPLAPDWEATVAGGAVFAGWDAEGPNGVTLSVAVVPRRAGEAESLPART